MAIFPTTSKKLQVFQTYNDTIQPVILVPTVQFSQCDYRLNGNNKILESSKTKDVFILYSMATSRFLVRP